MIDIDRAKKNFIEYVKKYDTNNENIKRKEQHSLRVMKICEKIAKELKLTEEKIRLAVLIGLLHDIGRFEQYTIYETFSDKLSVDHADLGEKILDNNNFIRDFIIDDKYDKIIKCAIRNHNKYEIQKEIDEQELLYAKIIRDADKIDILYETAEGMVLSENERNKIENSSISFEYFEQFKRKKTIIKDGNETCLDKLILTVALFDIFIEKKSKVMI